MNWYIAKLIFNIDVNYGNNTKQFDEQLRLVSAKTNTEAYYKAKLIGTNEELDFVNENNTHINWKFIDVAELILLNEIKDGMEVYSTTVETEKSNAYIYQTKLRANQFHNEQVEPMAYQNN
ncbi:MAG: hypothetical protein RJA07_2524 [Bacteroidota bacterium]|jgi:hypothetical protein